MSRPHRIIKSSKMLIGSVIFKNLLTKTYTFKIEKDLEIIVLTVLINLEEKMSPRRMSYPDDRKHSDIAVSKRMKTDRK